MKSMYKKLLIIFVIICMPSMVDAATEQFNLCCQNIGMYSITFDSSINTEVVKDKINCDNVVNQHLDYPNGIEDNKYKFSVVKVAEDCRTVNGEMVKCPSGDDSEDGSNVFQNNVKNFYYNGDKINETNVRYTIDNKGGFNLSLSKPEKGKYKIMYFLTPKKSVSGNDEIDYSAFVYQEWTPKGKNYVLNSVPGNYSIVMEFYQVGGNDGCDGAFVGHLEIPTPDPTQFVVKPNPIPNDKSIGCAAFKKWTPKSVGYDKEQLAAAKKSYAPACYESEIKYSELLLAKEATIEGIKGLKELYDIEDFIKVKKAEAEAKGETFDASQYMQTATPTSNTAAYHCTGNHNGTTSIETWTGVWWSYRCVINYSAKGLDKAQLVHAGDGFQYRAQFTLTRSCDVKQIKQPYSGNGTQYTPVYCPVPAYKAKCVTHCYWNDSKGRHEENGDVGNAGPSEEFDQCVNSCDNGKYSQECINSCYNKVYKKSRDLSFSANYTLDDKKNSDIQFTSIEVYKPSIPNLAEITISTTSGYTSHGRPAVVYSMKVTNPNDPSVKTCVAKVSTDYCALGKGGCSFEIVYEQDGYNLDYCGMVASAAGAEQGFIYGDDEGPGVLNNEKELVVDEDKFSMTILDSYSYGGKGNRKIVFTKNGKNGTNKGLNVKVDKTGGSKAVVTISLPTSYINKKTGLATYYYGGSGYIDTDKEFFEQVAFPNSDSAIRGQYFEGGRKYYTNVHSKNINVEYKKDGIYAKQKVLNIWASSKDKDGKGALGYNNHYGSTINCYYGVYNTLYNYCENGEQLVCDEDNEVCSCGIRYIFRPIELTDVFPNGRNPRYNWSKSSFGKGLDLYGYNPNPVGYTEWLQTEGRADYLYDEGNKNKEIDYEFILTPKSIAAIKNYNNQIRKNTLSPQSSSICGSLGKGGTNDLNCDGSRNYLDYDMDCSKVNGKQYCVSHFLDRTDILNYGSNTNVNQRHAIIGCNNARDEKCDFTSHGY